LEIGRRASGRVEIRAIRAPEAVHELEGRSVGHDPEQEDRVHFLRERAADRGQEQPSDPLVRERDMHERDRAEEETRAAVALRLVQQTVLVLAPVALRLLLEELEEERQGGKDAGRSLRAAKGAGLLNTRAVDA